MTKSFFFLVAVIIFSLVSIFHFSRLALEWKIIINDWVLPGWISGLIVILGIFMSYWSLRLRKISQENKLKENSEEKENEKSNF